MKGLAHFEFRSPYKPARRIPVSETGYRSGFADMKQVKVAGGPKERLTALAILRGKARAVEKVDDGQLALF